MLLEEGVCYDQCIFLAKLYYSLPCFIPYSKAKFGLEIRNELIGKEKKKTLIKLLQQTGQVAIYKRRNEGRGQGAENHISYKQQESIGR